MRYVLGAGTVLLLAVLAAGFWLGGAVAEPGPLTAEKRVYIAPGGGIRAVARTLAEEGVVSRPWAFAVEARWQARRAPLQAGEYQFPARARIADVIGLLQSGKTFQHSLTVAEGLTSAEIISLLNAEAVLTGEAETPPEGALLPETYHFSYGDSRATLILRMQRALKAAEAELWPARDDDLPFAAWHQAVTLASIVEKETGIASERARVAGVFINRLRIGMPLQSDPTVIYAVTGGRQKMTRGITVSDLKTPSPYNTYVVRGLPPAPIAHPGRASLQAVLHPERHGYLYFVADGTGGHVFAQTLAAHEKNVKRWRALEKTRAAGDAGGVD